MMTDEMHDSGGWVDMTRDERIEWLADRVKELERRVEPIEMVVKKLNGDGMAAE